MRNIMGTICLAFAVLIGSAGVSWSEKLRLTCVSTVEEMIITISDNPPLIGCNPLGGNGGSMFAETVVLPNSNRVYGGWEKTKHNEYEIVGKNEGSTITINRYTGKAWVYERERRWEGLIRFPVEYTCVKSRKRF